MLRKAKREAILRILEETYKDTKTALNYNSPFELLVAVILSAQCTDERVNVITSRIFPKYNTPEKMGALTQEELEREIHDCGLFHAKAKNLLATCKMLVEKFNSTVPDNIPQKHAVKTVQHAAVSGDELAVILDARIALDGRSRKVADLCKEGTEKARQTAEKHDVYAFQRLCMADPCTEDECQNRCGHNAAHGTLHRLFGAEGGNQLMLADGNACKICARIAAESRNKGQPDKQIAIGIFPNQINMGQKEKGIEKAKKSNHPFNSVGFCMADYGIDQKHYQKNGNKNAEIVIPIDDLINKNHIKGCKKIADYMGPLVFFGQCEIKFSHADQTEDADSRLQRHTAVNDQVKEYGQQNNCRKDSCFHSLSCNPCSKAGYFSFLPTVG